MLKEHFNVDFNVDFGLDFGHTKKKERKKKGKEIITQSCPIWQLLCLLPQLIHR